MPSRQSSHTNLFTPKNTAIVLIILFYGLFLIFPVVLALLGSFHNWNPLTGKSKFSGIDNYIRLFSSPLFWSSMKNTLIFSTAAIIARLLLGLGIALLLFSALTSLKTFLRAAFYMPVVTPLVAVAFVWVWIYNPQFGLLHQYFGTRINWLYDSRTALPAVIAMTIWKDYGYAVVLYLAGLYNLPKDCYEAARIDGANYLQTLRLLTIPLLKPMTLFILITSLISYLQAYIHILIMTEGGPGTSTYLASYLIFDEAFVKYHFGYASAISFVIFLLIGLLTAMFFRFNRAQKEIY